MIMKSSPFGWGRGAQSRPGLDFSDHFEDSSRILFDETDWNRLKVPGYARFLVKNRLKPIERCWKMLKDAKYAVKISDSVWRLGDKYDKMVQLL